MNSSSRKPYYTITEAAKELGITRAAVHRAVKQGRLEAERGEIIKLVRTKNEGLENLAAKPQLLPRFLTPSVGRKKIAITVDNPPSTVGIITTIYGSVGLCVALVAYGACRTRLDQPLGRSAFGSSAVGKEDARIIDHAADRSLASARLCSRDRGAVSFRDGSATGGLATLYPKRGLQKTCSTSSSSFAQLRAVQCHARALQVQKPGPWGTRHPHRGLCAMRSARFPKEDASAAGDFMAVRACNGPRVRRKWILKASRCLETKKFLRVRRHQRSTARKILCDPAQKEASSGIPGHGQGDPKAGSIRVDSGRGPNEKEATCYPNAYQPQS